MEYIGSIIPLLNYFISIVQWENASEKSGQIEEEWLLKTQLQEIIIVSFLFAPALTTTFTKKFSMERSGLSYLFQILQHTFLGRPVTIQ